MFPASLTILAALSVASAVFAFGIVAIPAIGIAQVLCGSFVSLLVIDILLNRKKAKGRATA